MKYRAEKGTACVYIARHESGWHKFGRTKDLEKRLGRLQYEHGSMELVALARCAFYVDKYLEDHIQRMVWAAFGFEPKRKCEWIPCISDELVECVNVDPVNKLWYEGDVKLLDFDWHVFYLRCAVEQHRQHVTDEDIKKFLEARRGRCPELAR